MELFSKSEEEPKRRLDLIYEGEVMAADWIEQADGEARDGCLGSGLPAVCLLDTLTPSVLQTNSPSIEKEILTSPRAQLPIYSHISNGNPSSIREWKPELRLKTHPATTPGKAALRHFVFSFCVGSVAT